MAKKDFDFLYNCFLFCYYLILGKKKNLKIFLAKEREGAPYLP